jgi:phosphoglycerol transferase MdoB-like AlkP superfamily enzyme
MIKDNRSWISLIPAKTRFWFIFFITGIALFMLLRALFLITHLQLTDGVSITAVLKAFIIGFRFDALILSIFILPQYLISLLPFIKLSDRVFQQIATYLWVLIFSIVVFMGMADLKFFDNFGSHLNFWAVEYIEYPGLFFYTITSSKGSWLLLSSWLIMTGLLYLIVSKIVSREYYSEKKSSSFFTYTVHIIVVALLILGIRGRIGIKPIDWGEAIFTDNQFVNQLPLNAPYTLSHSIYEELRDGKTIFGEGKYRFQFYDIDSAYHTTAGMLNIDINNDEINLNRNVSYENKLDYHPNIIIIMMESWTADKIGALGSELGISPKFDSLANHGILFTDFYANGVRTNRGISATLCSFPSLPGRSILRRYSAHYPFRSLADILAEYDYRSIFAYGGDLHFDNIKGFLKSNGFSRFYSEKDFDQSRALGKWGIPDHVIFEKLAEEIKTLSRPFMLTVLTLSYHDPFLIPDDRFRVYDDSLPDSDRYNCFYYSDWAIGQLISALREQPVFDSTIFVFTSDHCDRQSSQYYLSPETFHIPLLIYAPGIIGDSSRIITMTAGQVDILPTIIGILGLDTELYSWGRDVLNIKDNDPGYAVIVAGERLGLIEGQEFFVHWVGALKKMYNLNDTPFLSKDYIDSLPEKANRLEKNLNSYIQLANYLSRGDLTVKKSDLK